MVICDFKNDILFLGLKKIKNKFDAYASIMPFINEILNLLTITITNPTYNFDLYPHHPHSQSEDILKGIIDTLAITGIAANASKYGMEKDKVLGLVKGSIYAFFTFFIPNVFMHLVLNVSKNNMVKLLLGILFIYFLDLMVNIVFCTFLKYYKPKYKSDN